MHLAQLNVAHLRAPLDTPELADFVALLEPINLISDTSPGFVWRLKESDTDPSLTVQHDYGDHLVINYSIWESRDDLWNFVYKSPHIGVLQRRREWFLRIAQPYTVMWWVAEGVIPTLAQGMERLGRLQEEGPGPEAFTFKDFYSSDAAYLPAAAQARK